MWPGLSTTLTGERVVLEPLAPEHADGLRAAAALDGAAKRGRRDGEPRGTVAARGGRPRGVLHVGERRRQLTDVGVGVAQRRVGGVGAARQGGGVVGK